MHIVHDKQALFEGSAKEELISRMDLCLSYLLPNGIFRNGKFYVGNIRGDKGKSLIIETRGDKAGLWLDFATGEGGDIIDLWAVIHKKDIKIEFHEIMNSINNWLGNMHKYKTLDQPTASWNYYDKDNQLVAIVYRYDSNLGRKEYKPFDVKQHKYALPEIRPLYNIPGILKSNEVVLVEGEKCAEALIEQGIPATTAMSGANAPVNKTDWSPLKGKHIIIWPDNDEPGKQYAEKAARKLANLGVMSLSILHAPQDKPKGWDAADCILEGLSAKEFLSSATKMQYIKNVTSFSIRHYLSDTSPMPEDIIAPRILTPSGLLVFAGAPKVGKSDFLISWLVHMAAGIPFLGMIPKRPLRIFYLQTEIGYYYLRKRIQQLKLNKDILELALDNLVITSQTKLLLNGSGIDDILDEIKMSFNLSIIDIIAIDPLRNIFDSSENGSENDNNAMLLFLQERIEKLRSFANPNAGIILVHHTKKIPKKLLEEDPFQSFSGASSLRGFYTTGMIMFRPDEKSSNCQLMFELRNGHPISSRCIDKINNYWHEVDSESHRLANKEYGEKLDAERSRRHDIILDLIYQEGRKGNIYTINQFSQAFENKESLGSRHSIRDRLDVLATKGYIKFNKQGKNAARNKYGILCVEGMVFREKMSDLQTDKKITVYNRLLPTHYKSPHYGSVMPLEDPNIWIYHN